MRLGFPSSPPRKAQTPTSGVATQSWQPGLPLLGRHGRLYQRPEFPLTTGAFSWASYSNLRFCGRIWESANQGKRICVVSWEGTHGRETKATLHVLRRR